MIFQMFLFMTFAINVTLTPAGVSTNCDRLLMKLNAIRLNDVSHEVHERVLVLETGLRNANTGKGIGFSVYGVVVNKKMIYKVTLQIFSAAAFVAPILNEKKQLMTQTAKASTDCGLSDAQMATARVLFANATCNLDTRLG